MSFQEPRSDMSICNKALAKIYQQPLSGSLLDPANQNKTAGRECTRFYKTVVRRLLERHHFGLATKRQPLIGIANTRTAEWPQAYQAPNDMAFPVAIPQLGSAGTTSYYVGVGYLLASLYGRPVFRYEGGVIYSSVAGAELDYVSFDITENDFNDTFEQLVVSFLAAELAAPIAKDRALAKDLKSEAMAELNQAIAQSLNLQGQRYGDTPSEAELARGSALVDHTLMGWRF